MENFSSSILKFLKLDSLVENVVGFVEARIELTKIEVREDMAKAIARGLMFTVLFLMGFLFLIFFSVGLAHFLNQFLNQTYAGYWWVAGIYGTTFLALIVFRKNLFEYFQKQMKEMITKRKEN